MLLICQNNTRTGKPFDFFGCSQTINIVSLLLARAFTTVPYVYYHTYLARDYRIVRHQGQTFCGTELPGIGLLN